MALNVSMFDRTNINETLAEAVSRGIWSTLTQYVQRQAPRLGNRFAWSRNPQ